MLADAKQHVDAIPTDRNVREIVAVCAKHGLEYGRVPDFAPFMRALESDKHLAMNFWAAVARIERNNGILPPGALLESIVAAVTSSSVSEVKAAGASEMALVGKLSSMLAGEDIQPPASIEVAETEPEEAKHFEMTARRLEKARQRFLSETRGDGAKSATASLPVIVRQAPPLSDDRPRLVLEPEPPVNAIPPIPASENKEDEPSISIPLASYVESTPRRRLSPTLIFSIALLLLLGASGYWLYRSRNLPIWGRIVASGRAGYTAAVTTWNESAPEAQQSGEPALHKLSSSAPLVPAATATQQSGPGAQTPAPSTASGTSSSAKNPPTQQGHPLAVAASQPQSASPTDAERARTAQDPSVVVRASVMKQYLISSRVPLYPDDARDQGISGNVVMEAVVGPTGAVEHLHVLDGATALRRAAIDAVSAWRYRPYLVDGQPTAVATTISVYVGPEH